MKYTRIQLGDKGYLDLKQELSVPLNFSIAEIQDISKRQGGYSKTITLPGNNNNNNVLSNLFDVNIVDASFDINVKQRCQIIQNGLSVFDGYLQLLNVNKLSPSLGNPDEFVEYEIQVRDDSGSFYSSLQEKMLEDLPYWSQYNHNYTLSAITATSAHTVDNGYTYFLPFNASILYRITDFAPAIYAKAYWDRIFLEAGYTYEWDSLEDCNFDKLIIPYNGDTPLSDTVQTRASLLSGYTKQIDIKFVFSTNTGQDKVIFGDTVTFPNADPTGNYNETTGLYTSDFVGSLEIKTIYEYEVYLYAPVACQLKNFFTFGDPKVSIRLFNNFFLNAVVDESVSSDYLQTNIYDSATPLNLPVGETFFLSGTTPIMGGIFNLIPGETLEIKTGGQLDYQGLWFDSTGALVLPTANYPFLRIKIKKHSNNTEVNYLTITPTNSINEGQLVNLQNFIPKKIKQKDFMAGIVKMFNLYITPDKNIENNLIIQTRNDYYDSGDIIDWTQKFAVDNQAQLKFLPDLQDKRLVLTYKQDTDEWNKLYESATAEVYGQVQYEFDTEFTQSTKKIENIFSPTPIIPNANGLLVPAILNNNPKTNIRILYYDGWKDGSWRFKDFSAPPTTFSKYPRALHFDDPINPTIDINYAQTDFLGYSTYQTLTNNNLYNKYWSRFINQIETGKLLKGTFLLNENDISSLDLRSKVWIHDCYWNINKIIDYNPNGNGLTKVELISVDTGLKFAPFSIDRTNSANTLTDIGIKNNWATNYVSLRDTQSKNLYGTTVVDTPVFGSDNIIQPGTKSSMVLGDNNNYSGRLGFVSGDNNNIQGDNLYVFGASGQTFTGSSQAIFNVPVVATTISATTLYVSGSITPIEPSVFSLGSTGTYSVKQITDTTTDATGAYAYAEGSNTTASGLASHAEGESTTASANYTHSEGEGTYAQGINSHAQGKGSNAVGYYSHAGGNYSKAQYDGEISSNGISSSTLGRTQFGQVNSIGFTTNAAPVLIDFNTGALAQNGFAPPIAVTSATDLAMSFTYQIACFKTATGDARLVTGEGIIKWIAGTPTLVYASVPASNGSAGLAAIVVAPVASGLGLQFQVTGIAASNLRWTLRMDYNW
jgi:hypothetical protein